MSELIDELKQEHAQLLKVLENVKEQNYTSEEARKKLFESKEALINHVEKEDQYLYPALRKRGEGNSEIQGTVNDFTSEMQEITNEVKDFFSRYEEASEGVDFTQDLGKLIAKLQARIRKEEMILYPKYEQLVEAEQ